MEFKHGRGIKGPLTKGLIEGWERTRSGGNYAKGRDFLWVHWEVHDHEPTSIKLHVETPSATIDEDHNHSSAASSPRSCSGWIKSAPPVPAVHARLELHKRLPVKAQRGN